MARYRFDQSAWMIHFVHDYDPNKDPNFVYKTEGVDLWQPYAVEDNANARYQSWEAVDRECGLQPGDGAVKVLLKILEDGHIRSGWSFRDGWATVFGSYSACCFTEMPLYSLIDYAARRREGSTLVRAYGVALLRKELHRAGGRHVIYGLSGPERLVDRTARWPRFLRSECGIGDHEQYRYVPTRLGNYPGASDWTHEREWRWSDVHGRCLTPGLPVWLADQPFQFTETRLIVESDAEAECLKDKLKELCDDSVQRKDRQFNRATLKGTGVISIERLVREMGDKALERVRIDDIPVEYMPGFHVPTIPAWYSHQVKMAISEANGAARKAAAEWRDGLRDYPAGFGRIQGAYRVLVLSSQSDFLQAALDLDLARSRGGAGYELHTVLNGAVEQGALDESLAAARAAEQKILSLLPTADLWISGELDGI